MSSKYPDQGSNPANKIFWDEMRNHDYSGSFTGVSNFIQQNSTQITHNRRRQYGVWMVAILLPLLIFLSCQRKTFMLPQGATLTFMVSDSLNPAVMQLVRQHADKEWKAIFKPHAGAVLGTVFTPVEQYEKLKTFTEKLRAMPGVSEVYHTAIRTMIKESYVSRLSYRLFNHHIDDINASAQWRNEISRKLIETGLGNVQLQLVKEGRIRQVKLVPTGKTKDSSLAFALGDGTMVTAIVERW
jgi:hypothetical protein